MFCRARCKESKEQRSLEIIESCIRLYKTNKFEDITISTISKEAGWTRSNFYKYYKTKEEAFLDVVLYLFEDWEKTLLDSLLIKKELTPYSFANFWLESYEKNHMYTKLICLTSSLIEDHSSLEKIIEFKKSFFEKSSKTMESINEITGAGNKNVYKFFISQSAIVNGGYSYFKISEKKKLALESIDFDYNTQEVKEIIIENIEAVAELYLFKK